MEKLTLSIAAGNRLGSTVFAVALIHGLLVLAMVVLLVVPARILLLKLLVAGVCVAVLSCPDSQYCMTNKLITSSTVGQPGGTTAAGLLLLLLVLLLVLLMRPLLLLSLLLLG